MTYAWDFGDGTPDSNAPNPSHTYPKNSGPWTVTLRVTNAGGTRSVQHTVNT
jgi:cytochrome c